MPKKQDIIDDLGDDEFAVELDPKQKPSRKFAGDDADPTDAETGEELFADITPRLRTVTDADPEQDPEEEEESEDEDDLPEDDDDDRDSEEVDSEEEDRPSKKQAKGKSNSWSRRLERERRLRQEEQENGRELRERLTKLEQSVKSRADTEKFTRESGELRQKIADTQAKLKQAIEDGETDAQATLNSELIDLRVDLKDKERDHARAVEEAKSIDKTPAESNIVLRKVKQWMRKHPRYNRDITFQGFVRGVDKALAADGFDPETDEYYREMDKRIKKRYPEEYKMQRKDEDLDAEETEEEDPPPRRKHPSANLRRGNDKPSKSAKEFNIQNGKVTLTDRQKANMRKFQMDPTNKDDVREYVLNNTRK